MCLYEYNVQELSNPDVYATVRDFVKCAEMAKLAGYDGVEVMQCENICSLLRFYAQ